MDIKYCLDAVYFGGGCDPNKVIEFFGNFAYRPFRKGRYAMENAQIVLPRNRPVGLISNTTTRIMNEIANL